MKNHLLLNILFALLGAFILIASYAFLYFSGWFFTLQIDISYKIFSKPIAYPIIAALAYASIAILFLFLNCLGRDVWDLIRARTNNKN